MDVHCFFLRASSWDWLKSIASTAAALAAPTDTGMPLSLEDDDGVATVAAAGRPPLASSAERMALAEALLREGLGRHRRRGGGGDPSSDDGDDDGDMYDVRYLEAVSLVLGAAVATLAALYGRGVLPYGGGSAAQR
jgi:hypothetical protein